MNLREGRFRFIMLIVTVIVVFGSFIFALINLQIGQGAYYKELSEKRISTTETVSAARGNIYDRNGELLVTNRNGYNITLSKAVLQQGDQNATILGLCKLLSSYNTSYNDSLPITLTEPFTFDKSSDTNISALEKLFDTYHLGENATPTDLIKKMGEAYDVSPGYTPAEKRIIVGVRYEMEFREFTMSNPFILAEDVPIETVIAVSERSVEYPCVTVETAAYREYADPSITPHILGYIGKIWAEEYPDLKDQGYKMSDQVGKAGIEKVAENHLRGTDGVRLIERNASGEVLNVTTVSEPIQGDSVVLTIDKQLQITTQNALKNVITNLQNYHETRDASAGAAVVVQVDTGEVLASATYPTYDAATYLSNYNSLLENKDKPLLNRAFGGTYAPGSTFKMATAIAVLEEDVVQPSTKILDEGVYRKYTGYHPKCWRYTDYGATHGRVNVSEALRDSCNYFFYQSADEMGIDLLNKYCKQLGLGSKTGLEVSESAGILAGPESRNSEWYPGDTLQAAIGQSDNLFTPVQLATYVATIVNGGTRYRTHLIKSVKDSVSGRDVLVNAPAAVSEINIDEDNMDAVMEGMYLTAAEGTAANVFANYPVNIGCKTGTASVPSGTANGIFVAFAPYEDPEIAVCVVVEHGAHGNSIAPIAKMVFDEYFSINEYAGQEVGGIYLQP
ncbi:MAG: penicillin-binding protein [Clostridia bacterium]|nr:penicillin-binding protein [Clostridia bacterium]